MATRHERVVLTLEDNFTTSAAKAAAATALINRELKSLSGAAVGTHRPLRATAGDVDKVATASSRGQRDIDRFSGRLSLLRDAATSLGPALVPIGAVAVPAVAGLAAQFGAAAIAAGTAVAAFQGVGTALEAVNKAALEPSADNIAAARVALEELSPPAREFVNQLQDMRPALGVLRDSAAAGLFPGLGEGLREFESILPNVERLLFAVGDAAGDMGADLGEALSSERGREFLTFLQGEVPATLEAIGRATGSIAAGLGELWMAFAPLNRDFSDWLMGAAAGFDDWAAGLAETQGFQDFVTYIRETGPIVADALGSIGNAVLGIVQAAAPLGGPTLQALAAFADVIAAIANSSYGPTLVAVASGLALMSRAMKTLEAIKASSILQGIAGGADGAAGKLTKLQGAGIAAGIGLSAAAVAGTQLVELFREDLPGLEQLTAMLLDLREGALTSLPGEFDSLSESVDRLVNPSYWKGQQTSDTVLGFLGLEGRTLTNAKDEIGALEDALINVMQIQGPEAAEEAFAAVAANAGLSADEVANLRDLMPDFVDALVGVENQQRATGDAGEDAAVRVRRGYDQAKESLKDFRAELQRLNNQLEGRANARDYEAAVDEFTKGLNEIKDVSRLLNENGTLNIDLPKAREIEERFDAIAASALAVAENMSPKQGQEFLAQARQDLIKAGRQMGLTREEAVRLADRLNLLDAIRSRPTVKIDGYEVAMEQARAMQLAINRIKSKTVTVNTIFTSEGKYFKDGFASGGYTGNVSPAAVAGVVHGREVVIPEWLVRRDAAYLRSRYGFLPGMNNLPGYRSGGYVDSRSYDQRSYSSANSVPTAVTASVDPAMIRLIANEVSRMRPVYGDVHMQPHDYNQFQRQMEQDKRSKAGGGLG